MSSLVSLGSFFLFVRYTVPKSRIKSTIMNMVEIHVLSLLIVHQIFHTVAGILPRKQVYFPLYHLHLFNHNHPAALSSV
jgi:hypothetical protein